VHWHHRRTRVKDIVETLLRQQADTVKLTHSG